MNAFFSKYSLKVVCYTEILWQEQVDRSIKPESPKTIIG